MHTTSEKSQAIGYVWKVGFEDGQFVDRGWSSSHSWGGGMNGNGRVTSLDALVIMQVAADPEVSVASSSTHPDAGVDALITNSSPASCAAF